MPTAVFFHAHPDDEAISTGGTMAKLVTEGHRVVLVTATGGELGEFPDGLLDPGESLAERRAKELDAAAEALGVARLVRLGYLDSGMAGTDGNTKAAAFCNTDVEEAASRLGALLDEERADALVTYDENGVYGHPDHIQVHRVGVRAAELAGTARLFLATQNRDYLQGLLGLAGEMQVELDEERRRMIDTLGVTEDRITTEVDVTEHLAAKRAAMRAHASQIGETSFFLAMPDEIFAIVWGKEWFIRAGVKPAGEREKALL